MTQALVVGAGPAGLSAAIGLARFGAEVTLIEKRARWADRVCGSFLNAEAMEHLHWLGIFNEASKNSFTAIPSFQLHSWKGPSLRQSTQQGTWAAASLSRKDLEDRLLQKAEEAGVRIHFGSRFIHAKKKNSCWLTRWKNSEGNNVDHVVHLLVLADGRHSIAAGNKGKKSSGWFGWNTLFKNTRQKPGEMSLHFFPHGYVGTLTLNDGTTNICGLSLQGAGESSWHAMYEKALSHEPHFKNLMGSPQQEREWHGVGPLPFTAWMRRGNGAFLVGDAAAVGDPFMGEGIGRALSAGPMIYHALKYTQQNYQPLEKSVATYERLWKQSYGWRFRLSFAFRQFIRKETPFPWGQSWIFKRPQIIQRSLPFFHQGFRPPQVAVPELVKNL